MPQYVRAKVTGDAPVRDALTREPVNPGGEVTLLVREPGSGRVTCPRHPKKGANNPKLRCLCGGTLIDPLVEQGVIGDVKPFDPDHTLIDPLVEQGVIGDVKPFDPDAKPVKADGK